MITASGPADNLGIAALAAVARAATSALGASGEVAGLVVEVLGEDAVRRLTVAGESPSLDLGLTVDGTELVLTLHDRGEPVSGPPSRLLALVDLGFMTAADGRIEEGRNAAVVRIALPSHRRIVSDEGVEVLSEEVALSDAPVTIRPLEASDAAALSRCIYRCYGWSYPGVSLYFPDRVAAAIESGKRIGEVAVTEDGEVAAHWGAVFVADGVVETGGTVTDPRFRRRGIANELGDRLLARLRESGVRGRMREPVLTHPATQKIALSEGAHLVGAHLGAVVPIQQVGITDGMLDSRSSLTLMYSPLVEMHPAKIWVPAPYESLVRRLLEPTDWPRDLAEVRGKPTCPQHSVIGSSYDAYNRAGLVEVFTAGSDLIDAVDGALGELRSGGADVVLVRLPANQEAVASLGAGMPALGLSFASLLPDFGPFGDALNLQWLREPEVDSAGFVYATDHVREVVSLIVAQAQQVGSDTEMLRRRHARRQRLFAALPTN
jgi:GNAT superfamily N-acetyltransferase